MSWIIFPKLPQIDPFETPTRPWAWPTRKTVPLTEPAVGEDYYKKLEEMLNPHLSGVSKLFLDWKFETNEDGQKVTAQKQLDVPGIGKEHVKVSYFPKEKQVVIECDNKNGKRYSFKLPIPKGIDETDQSALTVKCENGILYLSVKLKTKEKENKSVEIKVL